MAQPGFMIYYDDWREFAEDYSDEELGQILRALFSYFDAHEETAFSDRGMRQFFRQATKGIDLDVRRYEDKCRQNAYNRYRGVCKQQHEKPLSFEQWLREVNARHQASPIPTTNNQLPETNNQLSETSNQLSEMNIQKSAPISSTNESCARGFPEVYRPLSEDEFEKRREAALASLRAASQRFPQEMPKKGRPPCVSG